MFTTNRYLQEAIAAIQSGNRKRGYELLAEVIQADPHSSDAESAWLWMSKIVVDRGQKRECLKEVLKINPYNEEAKRELSRLGARPGGKLGDDLKTTVGVLLDPLPARIILAVGAIVVIMSCIVCYFTGTLWTWFPVLTPATPTTVPRALPPTWTPLSPSSSSQGGPASVVMYDGEHANEVGEDWAIAQQTTWMLPDGRPCIRCEPDVPCSGFAASDHAPPESLFPAWPKYDTFLAILDDMNARQSEVA